MKIEKFLTDHFKEFVDFCAAEYDVFFIHHDGDPTSRGYRLVHPNERKAVEKQNQWGVKHDAGTVESNDALAIQSQRLFPRATIERKKLV